MKFTETFTSATATHVKFDIYVPNVILRYKAVIQLHHGMCEHAGYYSKFCEYLASDGYVVVVPDFPGHGSSLHNFEQGYFGEGDPLQTLVADMQRLRNIISSRYPELPYFMIGNQLGSLVLREYLIRYSDFIQGAIIMATSGPMKHLTLKKMLIDIDILMKGPMHRSPTIKKLVYDRWTHSLIQGNYKTSDPLQWQNYIDDPMTEFTYTNQSYLDMIRYLKKVSTLDNIKKIPDYLSIYILSGKYDAFGKKGKGPQWFYQQLIKQGVKDVSIKIYPDAKQDILHEINKQDVYLDILTWLNERTYY